jgi:D-alanyl-D-alanine dipeptidase
MSAEEKTGTFPITLLRIDDPQILKIPDIDNQETMVSLLDMSQLVLPSQVKPTLPDITDSTTPYARETVKNMLQLAIRVLPRQYDFVLIEAQRTFQHQLEVFEQVKNEIQKTHQGVPEEKILLLTRAMASDPRIFSLHVTGGAVDVALAKHDTMTYLDVGNLFQHDKTAASNYQGLTDEQLYNRRLLRDVMMHVGFVNYPREWWHWSYGDKLWAHLRNQSHAIYGPVK